VDHLLLRPQQRRQRLHTDHHGLPVARCEAAQRRRTLARRQESFGERSSLVKEIPRRAAPGTG
jgi:hypothetical protein